MRFFTLLLLCFSPLLFARDELVVHVASEKTLTPVVYEGVSGDAYAKKLEKIVRFDLEHNGHCRFVTSKGAYKIGGKVRGDALVLYITNVKTGAKQSLEIPKISGTLATDRRRVHAVCDTLSKRLFGKKGIASTHVLFTRGNEVWECDYDGANARQVSHESALCVTPTYLPNPSGGAPNAFVYVTYKIGQPKMHLARLSDGHAQRLSFLRGNQLMPSASRSCDRLAFISDITGNPELFVQTFNEAAGLTGRPQQIFSAPHGAQGTPTFSPDGKRIAFVSNKDGSPRIYVMPIPRPGASIKEIRPKLVSKQNRGNTCPAWSPDGTKLAYSAMTKGVREIWIYDFETAKETQLTSGGSHKENPTWAPDSLHLMFNTSTRNSNDLHLIDLHAKKATQITAGRFPSWEPLFS